MPSSPYSGTTASDCGPGITLPELDRNAFVWADDLLAADRVELAPLAHTAAVAAGQLPAAGFRGDPADSLLYATARKLAVPLVTNDRAIRGHAGDAGDVKTIW